MCCLSVGVGARQCRMHKDRVSCYARRRETRIVVEWNWVARCCQQHSSTHRALSCLWAICLRPLAAASPLRHQSRRTISVCWAFFSEPSQSTHQSSIHFLPRIPTARPQRTRTTPISPHASLEPPTPPYTPAHTPRFQRARSAPFRSTPRSDLTAPTSSCRPRCRDGNSSASCLSATVRTNLHPSVEGTRRAYTDRRRRRQELDHHISHQRVVCAQREYAKLHSLCA